LVNTISGGLVAGNEHLYDGLLDQNGGQHVDEQAGQSRPWKRKNLL